MNKISKRWGVLLPALTGAMLTPALAQSADDWHHTLDLSTQYYRWESDAVFPPGTPGANSEGDQLYVPFGYQIEGQPSGSLSLQGTVRSGFVRSTQDIAGLTSKVHAITDTSLSGNITFLGWQGIQPYLSLGLNMPTGRTIHTGGAAFAKADPDVAALATFGEGWNVAPTAGVNIPLNEQTILAFGFGYTYRGPFDRETATPPLTTRFNPGDVYTMNASLGYQSEAVATQMSFSYSLETETTINGASFYRAGNRYLVSGTFSYAWNEHWTTSVGSSWSHNSKNKVLSGALGLSPLAREAFNSNSNSYPVSLETSYAGANFSIGPVLSFLHRDHNAWSPTSFFFVPAKRSWGAGVKGQYAVADNLSLSGSVERIWVSESSSPTKSITGVLIPGTGIPGYDTLSWRMSFGVTYGF